MLGIPLPALEDTSLGGCVYQSSVLNYQKVSRKTTVLAASWIQQELCKSFDGMCWKGIDNRGELCCFLAGISLHLVLVCRSLPRIRLTSGGLLFSQIILKLSFVNRGINLMFLSGYFTTEWCIYTHVFKMYWKIQCTFRRWKIQWTFRLLSRIGLLFII